MKPSEFARKRLNELWEAYKANGGTQETLAAAAGVKQPQVSMWLRSISAPTVDSLASLAKGFGVPLWSLFPPDKSLLGDALTALAKFDDHELRTVLPYIETAPELAATTRLSQNKKLSQDGS